MNENHYKHSAIALPWLGALMSVSGLALAQHATERYIPIGESPGVTSHIGEIVAIDAPRRTLTIATADGRYTIRVTSATQIWQDRSGARRSNTSGTYADCEVGERAEVSYAADSPDVARWIKIEAN